MSSSSPLVLSTWNHGRAANAAAWEVLSTGGGSLDAVEAGARAVEDDPAFTSVGFGGLPDRGTSGVTDAMNALGYDAGSPDGVFGTTTSNAIRQYQAQAGLAETGSVTAELVDSNSLVRQ